MKIYLTENENKIFNILRKVCDYIEEKGNDKPTLRIAGGWVRDKLLGLESNDIDVAVDNMMGYDFALLVREYMINNNLEVSHMARVAANPEKNKNMETATGKVLGQSLDFVNLRSDKPTVIDSSEPNGYAVNYGTPTVDAFRRDITINALFYNIQTQEVEDFTKMGLDDLKNKIIRTPLSPYETFNDDPLRTLRVVRFASHFNYKIEETVLEAIKDKNIQEMLNTRTSRSRIGEELNKMLHGNDPLKAFEYLYALNLYNIVFARPPENTVVTIRSAISKAQVKEIQNQMQKKKKSKTDSNSNNKTINDDNDNNNKSINKENNNINNNLNHIHNVNNNNNYNNNININNDTNKNIEKSINNESSHPSTDEEKMKHLTSTIESILSDKSTNSEIDITIGLKASKALNNIIKKELYTTFIPSSYYPLNEKYIRFLYLACLLLPYKKVTFLERRREAIKTAPATVYIIRDALTLSKEDIDTVSKLHAIIPDTQEIVNKSFETKNKDREYYGHHLLKAAASPIKEKWPLSLILSFIDEIYDIEDENKISEILNKYKEFYNFVKQYKLEDIHHFQPIINGKIACKLLNLKAGPIIGEILNTVISWQLRNPEGTKEECEIWLKEEMKGK
ncbi:poly A polymerase C-terminal region-like protein [Anaeromyces robustus]|uniref:Poly A polymerase C-terminal region-like protein n=1 Tax=Anaeromyces robustus TaxID=1754192 RepID=A0A1Y1WVC5_9FUNG|nr:poly A polymerase C-terminal region-like protein [Anaeromyces robustus]|eukprot:ORX77412.1 poly A polymerase C-terminal region-like protein [Anaeromyces robustus]